MLNIPLNTGYNFNFFIETGEIESFIAEECMNTVKK